jgi:hypothetical protein
MVALLTLLLASAAQGQINPLNAHREYANSANKAGYQALNLHPSNLSLQNVNGQRYSLGLFQTESIIYNEEIKRNLFHRRTNYLSPSGELSYPKYQSLNMRNIMAQQLSINNEITHVGFSFQTKKAGSFGINVKSNVYFETDFNDFANEVLFQGDGFANYIDTVVSIILANLENGKLNEKKVFELLDDSYLKINITHEVNLAYSRQLYTNKTHTLLGGLRFGYVYGQADMAIRFNEGDIRGYVSRIPYLRQDLGAINLPNDIGNRSRSGHGFNGAIGATWLYRDKMKLALTLTDFGLIKWPVNPISIKQGLSDNIDLENGLETAFNDLIKDGIFYYSGSQRNIEWLPAKIILGFSYKAHPRVTTYLDALIPLNQSPKNLTGPIIGAGAEVNAWNRLYLRTGISYSEVRITMPTYLNVFVGKKRGYELGLGTADLLNYFMVQRNYFQAATGVFRFYF